MDPITMIVLGVIGLLGLLHTLFNKPGNALTPALPGPSKIEAKAEATAAVENVKAEQVHDAAIEQAKKDFIERNTILEEKLEDEAPKLTSDQDALNQHLQDVGKTVRGDS